MVRRIIACSFLEFFCLMTVISFCSGFLGVIVGVGGGIIVVPTLTAIFGIPPIYAIGASIVTVICTSSGAGIAAYNKRSPANYKIAALLLVPLTVGAMIGAQTTIYLARTGGEWLVYLAFGLIVFLCAIDLIIGRHQAFGRTNGPSNAISSRLGLDSSYFEQSTNEQIEYHPIRVPYGTTAMFGLGVISGLLGIGGGAFNTLSMHSIMKFPFKVSVSTSNFMIGITAATSAGILFSAGYFYPPIIAPSALGVLLGAICGRRYLTKAKTSLIRYIFVAVLVAIGIEMLLKGGLVTWLSSI